MIPLPSQAYFTTSRLPGCEQQYPCSQCYCTLRHSLINFKVMLMVDTAGSTCSGRWLRGAVIDVHVHLHNAAPGVLLAGLMSSEQGKGNFESAELGTARAGQCSRARKTACFPAHQQHGHCTSNSTGPPARLAGVGASDQPFGGKTFVPVRDVTVHTCQPSGHR